MTSSSSRMRQILDALLGERFGLRSTVREGDEKAWQRRQELEDELREFEAEQRRRRREEGA